MNYYEILKVSKNASSQEIRNSYKKLIKKYHPDIYKGNHEFAKKYTQDLNDAYDVLSNPEKKAEYDLSLEQKNIETNQPIYTKSQYYSSPKNENQKEPPKPTWIDILREKIYKIVDKKTANMTVKSKLLMLILIVLMALLFTAISINDYIRIIKIQNDMKDKLYVIENTVVDDFNTTKNGI